MWSYSVILFLSVVALAASGNPPKKQMFFDPEIIEQEPLDIGRRSFVDPTDGVNYRLSNNTYPIHYDISLKTDIHAGLFPFTGSVKIEIGVKVATNTIQIHQRQLTIIKVDLYNAQGKLIQEGIVTTYEAIPEFLNIPLTSQLVVGQIYTLHIDFSGTLRNDEAGFYRSSYSNSQGEAVWLATTQFESTDARHGFPCYDEPHLNAAYTIAIEHHQSYNAISNMPQESRLPVGATEYVITKFQKSFKFQTYLVAYVISDFDFISNMAAVPPQRAFATPAKIAAKEADFALDHGVKVVAELENYLGVKFLLPKLDQISIPNFAAGAMENFGLVTYRETALLYNPAYNTVDRQISVAEVIAHEYAHQWFGDHVSPAWWSYLWLNEGFATLFASYATGLVHPEWRENESFVTGTVHNVFQSDSLNPRAMTHYVESPRAISALFDSVAYAKAGSVLRMLQHVMTEETFAKGLKLYLDEKREDFATSDDLYRNLQTAIDNELLVQTPNISQFMKTWEYQAGYPVVNVARGTNNVLTITQERYRQASVDTSNVFWSIPVAYSTATNPTFTKTSPDFWITAKTMTMQSPAAKSWTVNDWILLNTQESGFYRVNYDLPLWKLLSDELNKGNISKIHLVNRAQLIDDSFDLAKTQRLPYSVPFDIISYLKFEDDYIPWAATNRALSFLHTYLIGSQYYERFRKLMRENVEKYYTRLGATAKPTDAFLDKFGRNTAINWACQMGHEQCLKDTAARMTLVSQGQTIEADHEGQIYCNGLRGADQTLFLAMWNLALGTRIADKATIMNNLGCSYDSTLIGIYLSTAIDTSNAYDVDDRARVYNAIFNNGGITGLNMIFDFVLNHYTQISVTTSNSTLMNIVNNLAIRVSNGSHMIKLQEMMTSLLAGQYISQENIITYTNSANSRLTWINANVPAIEKWLYDLDAVPTEPSVTYPPPTQTTGAVETTTNGSTTIVLSTFALLAAIFVRHLM